MKRVLLTGASGLVGRNAIGPLLERRFEVVAVARTRPEWADGDEAVTWLEADLLDDDARREVVARAAASHLLHLAWYAEPGLYWEATENLDWLRASVLLTGEFAGAGGRRAVYAGTCAEYPWGGSEPLVETTAAAPQTLYGIAKNATRVATTDLARSVGMSTAWGRIFFLYGPGEDERRLVASVARALAAGESVATTPGDQVRDFLFVADAGDAFAALLDSDVEGAVNVASGQGIAVREITARIAGISGRPDLVEVGALTPREGDPASIVADTSLISGQVGWRPATTLDDGLVATLEWWRAAQDNTVPGQ